MKKVSSKRIPPSPQSVASKLLTTPLFIINHARLSEVLYCEFVYLYMLNTTGRTLCYKQLELNNKKKNVMRFSNYMYPYINALFSVLC